MEGTLAQRLRTARMMNALSARQVAALAGVSPSTVTRVESGKMNPTYDVVLKLLDAVGLDERIDPVADPLAVATARWILGVGEEPPDVDYWINRWILTGTLKMDGVGDVTVPDLQTFAYRAGRAAALTWRPKVVRVRQDRSWDEVAAGLARADLVWAATGDRAANRLAPIATEAYPCFYVDDVKCAIDALGFTYKAPEEWGEPITLLPFDGFSEDGRWRDDDGIWYAAPWQVVLDCYGGSDRMPEQADELLELMLAPSEDEVAASA
ncbi:helix-turn-helix domain-containing protein [Nocardioides sp. NPDC059952]|uniref:helix-turn-helix domain-containing protein n=1 Tax=Nocardioides sp. NPDC059952 TaxID=3347014 RepID=UPI0036582D41